MLRSYRLSRPGIERCAAKHDVVWEANVTPIVLQLRGWGWISVYVEGTPSKFTRVFRTIFWPCWITGTVYPKWSGFRAFVAPEEVVISIEAPCDEILDIRFINILGFTSKTFKVPTYSGELGSVSCPEPKIIQNQRPAVAAKVRPEVQIKPYHISTPLEPALDVTLLRTPHVYIEAIQIEKQHVSPVITGTKFDKHFKL